MIDRRAVWKYEKKQKYGLWNSFADKKTYAPFEAIDKVDAARFTYNLLRLKEQSKIDRRDLPTNYSPQNYPNGYFCGYTFEK